MTTSTSKKTGVRRDSFAKKVAGADWDAITNEVNDYGCACCPSCSPPRSARIWPRCTGSRKASALR